MTAEMLKMRENTRRIKVLQGAAGVAGVTPLDACTRCSATAASCGDVHTETAFFLGLPSPSLSYGRFHHAQLGIVLFRESYIYIYIYVLAHRRECVCYASSAVIRVDGEMDASSDNDFTMFTRETSPRIFSLLARDVSATSSAFLFLSFLKIYTLFPDGETKTQRTDFPRRVSNLVRRKQKVTEYRVREKKYFILCDLTESCERRFDFSLGSLQIFHQS